MMRVILNLRRASGVFEEDGLSSPCGHPIVPRTGESIYYENSTYLVEDVAWSYAEPPTVFVYACEIAR